MKTAVRTALFALALSATMSAQAADDKAQAAPAQTKAQAPAPVMHEGVDISPLVEHFRGYVKTLKKSVFVYNWSKAGSLPYWNQDRPEGDPAALNYVNRYSPSFWVGYGSPKGTENMYGFGLYAAVDPIETWSYGGGSYYGSSYGNNNGWLLVQMELPAGFKMVDVGDTMWSYTSTASPEAQALATQFLCKTNPNDIFVNGGAALKPECLRLARKIFKDIFQIDGFAYSYGATSFAACAGNYKGHKAFVLTSNAWVKPNLVRAFSKASRAYKEDRIRIQTLFLEAKNSTKAVDVSKMASGKILSYIMAHPDRAVTGSSTNCAGDICVITLKFCDAKNTCENVDLDPIPRKGGGVITLAEAQKTIAGGLLWDDLAGEKKTDTIVNWIKENRYRCTQDSPFAEDDKK